MLPLNPAKLPEQVQKARKLQAAGRLGEAKALYEKLMRIAPARVEIPFQLAVIAWQQGNESHAIELLRKAHSLRPDEPRILKALSDRLFDLGESREALEIDTAMIETAPRDAGLRIDKAFKLQLLGEFDAAESELWMAIKLDPTRGEPYRMLARNRKIEAGDPLISKMRKALEQKKLRPGAREEIQFAMAKAMEDSKQYDKVFRYLRPANEAMKTRYAYRVQERWDEVEALIDSFRGFDFTPPPASEDGFAPIFVTGLPRSGTTLVERILASHSEVSAGGEMPFALRSTYQVTRTATATFKPMSQITPAELDRIGTTYEGLVRKSVQFDRIVTDKAIQAHLAMGLLKQAIPGARFIVVRRDPRDGLYSIYKNMFAHGTHRYAYDFEDLASYYATFLKILDFWREAMPGGFHEVQYEDLVADPAPQTRALIAAAGLDWEDACLRSHESKGAVSTLSMQQVRQPIYRSSAAAWRRYEKDLQPLIEALEREGCL
ncbi:sulfotransferase [Tropicimonas sp. TH_r6]|uniref:tetratricopeptide repeat-containing sulfotransferase family protein n=1 Tax=Tropicimonas sp. TH_r6 TaxID=3082085 RepID=UPI0029534682|nr:sulfotransferase [Tropicimonas sp. TH_r6]MDV7144694.1 sulfotransferase [Tropicimonas sp. TH_r6]